MTEEIKKEGVNRKQRKNEEDSPGALFIPAGVLTGMGFGFLTGNLVAGLFIGLGVGFTFFAFYEVVKNVK